MQQKMVTACDCRQGLANTCQGVCQVSRGEKRGNDDISSRSGFLGIPPSRGHQVLLTRGCPTTSALVSRNDGGLHGDRLGGFLTVVSGIPRWNCSVDTHWLLCAPEGEKGTSNSRRPLSTPTEVPLSVSVSHPTRT